MASEAIPRVVCDTVLHRLHDDFRCLLNFHSIYSLLNSHHLLSPSLDQSVLTSPTTTIEHKIDIVISWLPKCEMDDYLSPFVECLLESVLQAGEAHRELADMINAECRKEMLAIAEGDRDSLGSDDVEKDGGINADGESETLLDVRGCGVRRRQRRQLLTYWCVIYIFLLATLVVVWIASSLAYNFFVQSNLNDIVMKASEEGGVIPLDVNAKWVESMKVTLAVAEHFVGTVFVVRGASCSMLPTTHFTSSNQGNSSLFYALKGTTIEISISEQLIWDQKGCVHLWITPDIETWEHLNGQTQPNGYPAYNCDDYQNASQDALRCFPVYDNSTVSYLVTKPGFHLFHLTDKTDTTGILDPHYVKWQYNYTVYDLEAILEDGYQLSNSSIPDRSREDPHGIEVNYTRVLVPHILFADYNTDYCVLLELACDTDCSRQYFRVTELQSRKDVIALIFIIFLATVIFLSVVFVLFLVTWARQKLKH